MPAAAVALVVAFAFASPDGARLLVTSPISNPNLLRTALCTGAPPVSVQYERRQVEDNASTGRQNASNFTKTAGAVFRIVGAKVSAGTTCLVADEAFLKGAAVVALQRPRADERCSKAEYPWFQTTKSRPVVACWPIAASPDGTHVAILEFARRLTHALASLVVLDGDRRVYVDYAAEFNGPGADLWRADDGGEIHAEGFEVVCLVRRGTTYFLAVDWRGAEGSALSLWISEDAQFKEVITDSWYRSPL